jgi:hypothetical protein
VYILFKAITKGGNTMKKRAKLSQEENRRRAILRTKTSAFIKRRKIPLGLCRLCAVEPAQQIHHHSYDNDANIVFLCWGCHIKISNGQAQAPIGFRANMSKLIYAQSANETQELADEIRMLAAENELLHCGVLMPYIPNPYMFYI